MAKTFYVYILSSRPGGALYIGVTSDLIKRIWQHKNGIVKGHTKKYNIGHLIYYEIYEDPENAILREKRLKKWNRAMKNDLIERYNPTWEDLYPGLLGENMCHSRVGGNLSHPTEKPEGKVAGTKGGVYD